MPEVLSQKSSKSLIEGPKHSGLSPWGLSPLFQMEVEAFSNELQPTHIMLT
jgi:hypothetical protein